MDDAAHLMLEGIRVALTSGTLRFATSSQQASSAEEGIRMNSDMPDGLHEAAARINADAKAIPGLASCHVDSESPPVLAYTFDTAESAQRFKVVVRRAGHRSALHDLSISTDRRFRTASGQRGRRRVAPPGSGAPGRERSLCQCVCGRQSGVRVSRTRRTGEPSDQSPRCKRYRLGALAERAASHG